VVDDDASNYYYFQIGDARKLGVKNYSQVKVLAKDQGKVLGVRKSIESSGFRTVSTLDTVAQIEGLFGTLRLLLGFLGTIALAVASLGMFNTMTVSLLERTREVGVMKAMGMRIAEVRELFLAESMIMGVGGGVTGIFLGFLGGRLLSLTLSSVSLIKGQGMIDISYVPWFFIAFILSVSFVVGIITGWYPSKRATKISALNALRYE
jgi:ABC-type antimicrobial peptide transport system permease subunit